MKWLYRAAATVAALSIAMGGYTYFTGEIEEATYLMVVAILNNQAASFFGSKL